MQGYFARSTTGEGRPKRVAMRFRDAAKTAADLARDYALQSFRRGVTGSEGELGAAGVVFRGEEALGVADGVGDGFCAGVSDGGDSAVEIVSVGDGLCSTAEDDAFSVVIRPSASWAQDVAPLESHIAVMRPSL